MDNVFPEHQLPHSINDIGQIRNLETNDCIDAMAGVAVNMQKCHGDGGFQQFMLTNVNELKNDEMCIDSPASNSPVILFACHGMHGNQHWSYNQTVSYVSKEQYKVTNA